MKENIVKKLIFNPDGDDGLINRRIIKGNTTNLFNLNEVKYSWSKSFYRVMLANFWIPEKVDLSMDIQQYKDLSKDEVKAFERIISFLTFLDSIQTNNIPNISEYITAPEVSTLLAIQQFQEVIHSQSYAYILETVIPSHKRAKVYEYWRKDKLLFERNKHIANIYQEFIDTPNDKNFARMILANYILESLYFYNGFIFFYNLANKNTMLGVADEIRYINRDEETHTKLFVNIIKTINEENGDYFTQDLVNELFTAAVQEEINWTNYILAGNIIGMNEESTEKYTKYLANKRIIDIGFEPLYPEYIENPYYYLEKHADLEGDGIKSNFFESKNSAYQNSTAVDGWDEI